MSEPKRQHPVAAITQVLQIIKQNFFTILVVLFVGSGGDGIFGFIGILPVMLFLLVAGLLEWWRFTYQIVDGDLHIKRGVIVRKNLYLSPERIQVIDINAGLIQRLFGLVSVEVKTAGTSSKDAKINAVSREEAERIRNILPKRRERAEEDEASISVPKVYKLGTKELAIAAATSGNITLTLALVAGALSQVQQFLTEEQIIDFITYAIPGGFEISIALSFVILALVAAWLLSFFGTIVKYYGFELKVFTDELHVQTGLLTQKQSTVPFNRIQGLRIKEELLREPFGLRKLMIESAGYGEENSNATTLFPLIHKSEMAAFLEEVLPEFNVSVDDIQPPVRSLRRYIQRLVWLALLVIIPLWIWVPYGVFSLILIIPAVILGYAQYKASAIGVTGETMVVKSRILSRRMAIIKRPRIQAVENKQNPFQKRLALASFNLTIASGSRGRTFMVRELDEEMASSFLSWVSPLKKPDGKII